MWFVFICNWGNSHHDSASTFRSHRHNRPWISYYHRGVWRLCDGFESISCRMFPNTLQIDLGTGRVGLASAYIRKLQSLLYLEFTSGGIYKWASRPSKSSVLLVLLSEPFFILVSAVPKPTKRTRTDGIMKTDQNIGWSCCPPDISQSDSRSSLGLHILWATPSAASPRPLLIAIRLSLLDIFANRP